MVEPTVPAYSDFTNREFRPDHVGEPTPRGVSYPINMTPQKAARLLNKAASKPGLDGRRKGKGGKGKGKKSDAAQAKPVQAAGGKK